MTQINNAYNNLSLTLHFPKPMEFTLTGKCVK